MIRVFTTPNCRECRAAKDFLRERGVEFEEVNVEGAFGALRTMIKLSGAKTVPVIQIEDQVIVGFDRSRLESLL